MNFFDPHLRLLQEDDAEAYFRAVDRDRKRLREWLFWVDFTTSADAVRAYIRLSLERFAAGEALDLGIWEGGELVGCAGYAGLDAHNRSASLGYWIAGSHEGRGLVTNACRVLLARLFNERVLHRIEIACGVENARSNAIAKRLGFTRERIERHGQHINGRYQDLAIWSAVGRTSVPLSSGAPELRLLELHHAPAFFATVERNREHLARWLPWVEYTTTEDNTRQFLRRALEGFARGEALHLGIWCEGALVGGIGHRPIDALNRRTSIGYWIDSEYEGRGLVTRAVRAVLDHLFDRKRLHRVEIRCAPGNTRSCAIPERLGFTPEGIAREAQRIGDAHMDLVVWSMLAGDWRRIRE